MITFRGGIMRKVQNREHYVDNKKFYAEMLRYRNMCVEAEKEGKQQPRVPNYIGDCIMRIAYKLSNKPNFINYPFKEEMIGDGIENCIMYVNNFNPDKSTNPFAYFTQIIYYAYLRRIEKEKKALYTKYKATEMFNLDSMLSGEDRELIKSSEGASENASLFIQDFEEKRFNK
jgi:hypothetical protein|tara:strand:+ start:470 stop:988 length:519 start_codon:yes stop_codon:yes gene_type:complete